MNNTTSIVDNLQTDLRNSRNYTIYLEAVLKDAHKVIGNNISLITSKDKSKVLESIRVIIEGEEIKDKRFDRLR